MKAERNKTTLIAEVGQLKSQLRKSQQKRSTLEEKARLLEERVGTLQRQYEAQEMAKHITANDLENARSQVTAHRQDLDLARSEAKARDKAVKELEKKLEVVRDEQRRREQELEAFLNKRFEDARALAKELADAKGQLAQITTDSDKCAMA